MVEGIHVFAVLALVGRIVFAGGDVVAVAIIVAAGVVVMIMVVVGHLHIKIGIGTKNRASAAAFVPTMATAAGTTVGVAFVDGRRHEEAPSLYDTEFLAVLSLFLSCSV